MKKLIVLAASRLLPGRSPMKITRRFAVASLLVVAVAVVLGTPAPASAAKRKHLTYVKLYPAADTPFRHATGMGTAMPAIEGWAVYQWVSVSVSRLAPNASYYMPVTVSDTWSGTGTLWFINVPIQTDARGNGEGGYFIPPSNTGYSQYIVYQVFEVYDSSGTLVLTPVR